MMVADEKIAEIADSYAQQAISDYVGLWQICGRVEHDFCTKSQSQIKEISLRIVRKMLASGLQAVHLHSSDAGCDPWKEQDVDYVIGRIIAEWDALGHNPSVGDIVWFNNPRT